jgi:hypothetical protein
MPCATAVPEDINTRYRPPSSKTVHVTAAPLFLLAQHVWYG